MKTVDSSHKDLQAIAKCHRSAFPESLSSKLGLSYCRKMLSFYLENERGILFHLEEEGAVFGYCGGIRNRISGQHGSATSMTQHTFRLLVLNLLFRPWLIFHNEILANFPLIIKNIKLRFYTTNRSKSQPQPSSIKEFIPSMGLVVIGVSPKHQGKGYGSLLLKDFEERASKEEFTRIHLSVNKNNSQAIAAYKKNGWLIGKEGHTELHMFKNLD
jgi:GNAT superfamily N-acetyltransferase